MPEDPDIDFERRVAARAVERGFLVEGDVTRISEVPGQTGVGLGAGLIRAGRVSPEDWAALVEEVTTEEGPTRAFTDGPPVPILPPEAPRTTGT